jgi:stage V sporulation protein AD
MCTQEQAAADVLLWCLELHILKNMEEGYKRILLLSTGALLSTTSIQQGESIPGIAHAVVIDMNRG